MRRFEFVKDASSKYWEIEQSGVSFTVRYGRIGTKGQERVKTFSTEAESASACEKQIKSKQRKGYVEITGASAASTDPVAVPKPAAPKPIIDQKPSAKKLSAKKAAASS